jgi:hypothetical protein
MSSKRKAGAGQEESQAPVECPKVGSAVQIFWDGEWWDANVIEQSLGSRFVVEYPNARTAVDLVTSKEVLVRRNYGQLWRWPPSPNDAPHMKQQRRTKATAARPTTAAPNGKTAAAPATTAAPAVAAGGGAAGDGARGAPPPPLKAMIDGGFLLAGRQALVFKYRVRGFVLSRRVAGSQVVGSSDRATPARMARPPSAKLRRGRSVPSVPEPPCARACRSVMCNVARPGWLAIFLCVTVHHLGGGLAPRRTAVPVGRDRRRAPRPHGIDAFPAGVRLM